VIGLHGGLGSGDQFAENSQFERAAQESGFIAVFPDGVGRTWNGGNCCGRSARDRIDDVGFLAALIEHIAAQLPIDRSRVFMTGHSNGGILSFRFGCERPDLVAAVASVAGSLEIPDCEPAQGVDLLSIHGDADQSHPFDGGQGPRSIAGVDFVSQARSLELWTKGMGCTAKAGPQPSGETTLITWTGCQDGAEARLLVVHGADHPWPGGVGSRPAAQERTSDTIDATAVITEFFLDR
jgi:polyhydroxybutyrate depolymerase